MGNVEAEVFSSTRRTFSLLSPFTTLLRRMELKLYIYNIIVEPPPPPPSPKVYFSSLWPFFKVCSRSNNIMKLLNFMLRQTGLEERVYLMEWAQREKGTPASVCSFPHTERFTFTNNIVPSHLKYCMLPPPLLLLLLARKSRLLNPIIRKRGRGRDNTALNSSLIFFLIQASMVTQKETKTPAWRQILIRIRVFYFLSLRPTSALHTKDPRK